MSLFTNPIRPAPIASDAAIRRYIDAIRRQIEPDPLYRRRLRGEVVNRFVAQKQGVALTAVRGHSRMGALGRACLYASFALGVSVTGVMAASDAAIPGDLLYPLKRGIETVRLDVLPEQYRDELAAYALSERIGELGQLVEAGEMARASAFADSVHDAYDQAVAESDDPGALARRIDRQVARLEDVMSGLPAQARADIESAMVGAPGLSLDAWEPGGSESGAGPASSPPARAMVSARAGALPTRAGPAALRMTIRCRRRRRSRTARRGRTARRSRTAAQGPSRPRATMRAAPRRRARKSRAIRNQHIPEARPWDGRGDGISRRDGGEPPSRLCQGLAESHEAGISGPARCDAYRRRLRAFTFASAVAPSDPRNTTAMSSTGTVIG